ncbi:hypothetical protein TYRP_005431 [Tyrophagus putrescentiae]|nr:hypothetical protein TYRP_005431 [Tyrophagus putrescentiae]
MSRFLQPVPKWRVSCIIGYRGVGKSTIASSYVEGKFYHHYDPTIESILYKNINVKGTDYNMKIIDTAGQDEYTLFPPAYAQNIHGYLLVYSIDSKMSYKVAKITYDKLLEQTGNIILPMILVGNKSDLQEGPSCLRGRGQGAGQVHEVSLCGNEVHAKHISEVDNLFEYLLELIALDNPHLNPQHPTEGADGGDDKNKKCDIS